MIENSVKDNSKNQGKEHKMVISMTGINIKIQESESYDKAMNNLIYGHCQRKAIKKKLQNLKNHQTWKYNKLSLGQKVIRFKFSFKF